MLVGSKLCCALEIYVQTLLQAPDDPWPKHRCHTGNAPRSSSVNQLCSLAASPRAAGRCRRERILLQVSLYAIRAEKSRGGAPAPYRSPRARRVEAGPPPPPPAWPAHNLLFGTQRRRREKMRLLTGRTGFPRRFCLSYRCAGHQIAQFHDAPYALIVFLSTHGRELLAQTAKNRSQGWNRGKKLNCPARRLVRVTQRK